MPLIHPQFDPIAFSVGPVSVHWYGLMYLAGFFCFWLLGRLRSKDSWREISASDVEDLLTFGVLGVVLGGRLGFCLFYQPEWYLAHPLDIFKLWQGGMSAHGGIIGVTLVILYFAWSRNKSLFSISDFVTPLVPLGLFFGRIGNFINGELWGRVADENCPWAMVFPLSGSPFARHPSQLYEAGLEGIALFVLLWCLSRKKGRPGVVTACFCIGYAVARFTVEFFREPDAYLGFGLFGLTRGQWLSIPVLALGLALLCVSCMRGKSS